jgi:hypothetical protein
MELVASLLTDVPLDEHRFHGLLRDVAQSALAGAVLPRGMVATHSFGDAAADLHERNVVVRVQRAGTAAPAALTELRKTGFRPETVLDFDAPGDPDTREDAWALINLYAAELRGWVLTRYMDFDEAVARAGSEDGLLHVPLGGGDHKAVLISASTMEILAP